MRSLIVLALFGVALAAPKASQRVVGGETTTIEENRFVADMEYSNRGVYFEPSCGAALVSNNVLISVFSCYNGDETFQWRARLGTSVSGSGGSVQTLKSIVPHPEFDRYKNDVAVIILNNVVTLTTKIGLARLAGASYILPAGSTITALGYGSEVEGVEESAELKKVDVNIVDQQTCFAIYDAVQEEFPYWPTIDAGMVCTGVSADGGSACYGDNGAPVVTDGDVLYAMSSWGKNCADEEHPIVNTLVPRYTEWIISVAEGSA
ncbi:trypsin, alkaline C [Plutella xylostella]|uniref:trypsin, alkaline C n=1 Tax=Plutella xylostella TaxID=51655 RepID=UPI0020329D99|nr:trypsin, alkaline C [Plutella xylostella]